MNFSKTTEYSLQIMSLMAQDETRLYRTDDIYDKLKIPYRYLRKLMTSLVKKELIASEQGKFGGYRIKRPLEAISLMDILEANNDSYLSNTCFFGFGNCALIHKCSMHEKWISVRENIRLVLVNTSLAEIKKSGPVLIGPAE
ncbi:MAG: Rrf2 family transcriptional regulator [Bacteroidota bacterium]